MEIIVANPRGFCAGVERAVEVVDELLDLTGGPVFVRHAIVHNHDVVRRLETRGARFVADTDEVPDGAVLVFSAHGVSPIVTNAARSRNLRLIDATCPLVTRVQLEVVRQSAAGKSVIIIGHRGHVEVEGLAGNFRGPGTLSVVQDELEAENVNLPDPAAVAYVTQTTLAVSQAERIVRVLRSRFPQLSDPRGDTICYATQNRQQAVRTLARAADVIFVVGSGHSSNSNRMVEVAQEAGCAASLIESAEQIVNINLEGVRRIGLTAGASAPEHLVQEIIAEFSHRFPDIAVREFGTAESLHFKRPTQLLALKKEMRMENEKAVSGTDELATGLDDVIDTVTELARQVRESTVTVARLAERELAMAVSVAEETRDRAISPDLLSEARDMVVLKPLRESAHRGGDLVFDAVSVSLRLGVDAIDRFLSAPRRDDEQAKAA